MDRWCAYMGVDEIVGGDILIFWYECVEHGLLQEYWHGEVQNSCLA